ncbi:hypothetical protein AMTR_s00080p00155400 [Amborella trichopoda]|uniref:Uncharacterized protein n=1 Tax=Amborella trichopoda TaxID=13333 RepID=W1PD33_AMBTC|nr:hypothetical protein AMTR_s00080p00155400 [Amborella trichopoda]
MTWLEVVPHFTSIASLLYDCHDDNAYPLHPVTHGLPTKPLRLSKPAKHAKHVVLSPSPPTSPKAPILEVVIIVSTPSRHHGTFDLTCHQRESSPALRVEAIHVVDTTDDDVMVEASNELQGILVPIEAND